MSQVTITRRGAERAREGHLWVYRSDVREAGGVEGGAVVRVRDERGRGVGQALYSDRSEIPPSARYASKSLATSPFGSKSLKRS